jgi:UDP-N-acetyl-2-amino-2-deoxyglucuronate dehydrogenase
VLALASAKVHWHLGIETKATPRRIFNINGKDYDFTGGFTNLHNRVYELTLAGEGFGLEETRESIRLCERIRKNNHGD